MTVLWLFTILFSSYSRRLQHCSVSQVSLVTAGHLCDQLGDHQPYGRIRRVSLLVSQRLRLPRQVCLSVCPRSQGVDWLCIGLWSSRAKKNDHRDPDDRHLFDWRRGVVKVGSKKELSTSLWGPLQCNSFSFRLFFFLSLSPLSILFPSRPRQ